MTTASFREFRLPEAVRRDSGVAAWLAAHDDALGAIARHWFDAIRACGDDVRECLHDGQPTACVGDVAFAYVDAFTAHVNVGFYNGASLGDPHRLMIGDGRWMRHVKLGPAVAAADSVGLATLVREAYAAAKRFSDRARCA